MLLLDGPKSVIYSLAFAPDGRLAVGDREGWLTVWDSAGQSTPIHPPSPRPSTYSVAFRSDGELVYTHGPYLLSVRHDETYSTGSVHIKPPVSPVAVAVLDEDRIVVGCGSRLHREPGELLLWDLGNDKKRLSVPEPHGVRAVAALADSRLVAWATAQNRASVWDITRPDPTHFPLPANCPSVAIHPDAGTLAAAVGWNVMLFDIAAKRERRTLKGHTGQVSAVAFSPDGRTLATGSWDGTVRLWEPDTGAERTAFRWPIGRVFSLVYDPDGLRLAAGGDQGTVVVWDAQ